MESTTSQDQIKTQEESKVQDHQPKKESEPVEKEPYHDLGEYEAVIDKVNVEQKVVPTASYGHRIRIGKLYDSHEEFMYKVITVAGWARTLRAGGKDFCFIEIHDGSFMKGL